MLFFENNPLDSILFLVSVSKVTFANYIVYPTVKHLFIVVFLNAMLIGIS